MWAFSMALKWTNELKIYFIEVVLRAKSLEFIWSQTDNCIKCYEKKFLKDLIKLLKILNA